MCSQQSLVSVIFITLCAPLPSKEIVLENKTKQTNKQSSKLLERKSGRAGSCARLYASPGSCFLFCAWDEVVFPVTHWLRGLAESQWESTMLRKHPASVTSHCSCAFAGSTDKSSVLLKRNAALFPLLPTHSSPETRLTKLVRMAKIGSQNGQVNKPSEARAQEASASAGLQTSGLSCL